MMALYDEDRRIEFLSRGEFIKFFGDYNQFRKYKMCIDREYTYQKRAAINAIHKMIKFPNELREALPKEMGLSDKDLGDLEAKVLLSKSAI